MNVLSIIYPLAGTISGGGWANSYFDAIRKDCISHAGSISSIAMALACIFIAFKFIKMYYDFVSDEQHGGFGGVRTWDLLRPIVILIIIGNFGAFLGAFDSICNAVSSSLVSNMNARTSAVDAKLEDELTSGLWIDVVTADGKMYPVMIKKAMFESATKGTVDIVYYN